MVSLSLAEMAFIRDHSGKLGGEWIAVSREEHVKQEITEPKASRQDLQNLVRVGVAEPSEAMVLRRPAQLLSGAVMWLGQGPRLVWR